MGDNKSVDKRTPKLGVFLILEGNIFELQVEVIIDKTDRS